MTAGHTIRTGASADLSWDSGGDPASAHVLHREASAFPAVKHSKGQAELRKEQQRYSSLSEDRPKIIRPTHTRSAAPATDVRSEP